MNRKITFIVFAVIALWSSASTLRAAPALNATQLIERAQTTLRAAKKGADYKAAVADLTSALALEPKNARAYFWRGEAIRWALRFQNANPMAFADPDFDEKIFDGELARSDYSKAIELNPKMARALFGRGALSPSRKISVSMEWFWKESLADLDKAIALDPKIGEAYLQRAFLKSRLPKPNLDELFSDYDNALKFGFDAKAQDPIFVALINSRLVSVAYSGRALMWVLKNQNEKALADFSAAIAADSDNAQAFLGRAKIYELEGETAKAAADRKAAALLEPRTEFKIEAPKSNDPAPEFISLTPDAKLLMDLRNEQERLIQQNKPDEALQNYTRALKLNPQSAPLLDARAMLLAWMKRWDEAFDDLDAAIAFAPDDATYHVHRGSLRARHGDWANAISDLEDAIALDEQSAGAWEQIGIAQQAQGEYSQAELSYGQAVNFEGKGEVAALRSAPLAPLRLLIVRAAQDKPDAEQEKILGKTALRLLSTGVLLTEIELKKHPDSEPLKALRAKMTATRNIF